MKHTDVVSSNIASIGYDAEKQLLQVKFSKGGLYEYQHVPKAVHTELMSEPDGIGGRFHKLIKNGGYKWKRIEG